MDARPQRSITVGITTRNRFDSLARCVASIALIADLVQEIIVVDDAADPGLPDRLRLSAGNAFQVPIRVIAQPGTQGYIVARNRIAKEAATEFVLNLDDDAMLTESAGIRAALELIAKDSSVGAIGFAQTDQQGVLWPSGSQPAPVSHTCRVPCFIGYGHLLRKDLFLKMGGYCELFHYYGEEKDYCLRLLGAGHQVVYSPRFKVAHLADPAGRDATKYARYYHRNDCFAALSNLPLPVAALVIWLRWWRYPRIAREMGIDDRLGRGWLVAELRKHWRGLWSRRKPVSWSTLREWRRLRREWPAYQAPGTA